MKFVHIQQARPGDVVARTVYGHDRRPLIGYGTVLTVRYIERLQEIGIAGLYLVDEDLAGVEIEQGLDDQFVLEAIEKLSMIYKAVEHSKELPAKEAIHLANQITDHIFPKRDFIVQLRDIRLKQSFIYSHSINVTMLAVLTARGLGYNQLTIKEVALGALLHDIGYTRTQGGSAHPLAGFEILRHNYEIPLTSAHVALQHHEAINGTGFPFQRSGDQVREAAQIVAICNDYDHLINDIESTTLPHEALEYIMAQAGHKYRLEAVRAFVQNIAPYPIGTEVFLNNGQTGKVFYVSRELPMRPIVRINREEYLDLSKERTVFVSGVKKSGRSC